jgi:hypothetical protein
VSPSRNNGKTSGNETIVSLAPSSNYQLCAKEEHACRQAGLTSLKVNNIAQLTELGGAAACC